MSAHHCRTGLAVLGLLSVADLALPVLTNGSNPPYAVAIFGAALGAASLVLVVRAWRGPAGSVRVLLGLRIVSTLTALPAFVVGGVPTAAVVGAAASVGFTALGVTLVAGRPQLQAAR